MRKHNTIHKVWLVACVLVTMFPLSTMIAIAGKSEDRLQVETTLIDSMPPDPVFKDYSPEELIPYILGTKQLEDHDNKDIDDWDLACSWFIWKTQSNPKIRTQLADDIFIEMHCVKIQHDNSHLSELLGRLGMPDHLTALLETADKFDCCYGPSLVRNLAMCSSIDYAPIVIRSFDKESDGSLGCVQAALLKITGCPSDYNKTKADWITWWRKTYPNKELEPPSDKYRQLLADDRIVLIQKLRNIMSAMHKYGENKIGLYQYGPPSFPLGLNELVGREYTLGKKITEKHIQSVKYRKPSKDVWPPYNSLFLADDSLEKSHGLIAILHGEGRIHLVKPDDSGDKLKMVRMFWPNKWKESPNMVSHNNL